MVTKPTPQAIENAGQLIYTATSRNKPYEKLSLYKKEILRAQATKVLTGDLGDMVLVPREATAAMIDAGLMKDGGGLDDAGNRYIQNEVWRAMIAAAEESK